MFLRQSTASQSRIIGPFHDDVDFKTPETGLTIANTDVKLMVNGGASANKNSGGGTHRINGEYSFTFDATDTATVGQLEVSIAVAGALPLWKTFFVIEEAVYDSLFAASAVGYQVPIWATAGSTVNLSATTVKTATDVETKIGTPSDLGSGATLGANLADLDVSVSSGNLSAQDVRDAMKLAPTGGAPAADSIDQKVDDILLKVDPLPSDPADASVIAAAFSTVNTNLTALEEAIRGIDDDTLKTLSDQIDGLGGAGLTSQEVRDAMKLAPSAGLPDFGSVDKHLDDIQAKTDGLPSDPADASVIAGLIGALNNISAAQVNSEVDTALADYDGATAADLTSSQSAILAKLPAALTGAGNIKADMLAVNGSTTAAARQALAAAQMIPFTVTTAGFSPTTTEFEASDITEATGDHYNGAVVIWTSGALAGQRTAVSDYALVGGRGHLTVVSMTEPPANGDTGILV